MKAESSGSGDAIATKGGGFLGGVDVPLLLYFFFWYVGNYYVSDKISKTKLAHLSALSTSI